MHVTSLTLRVYKNTRIPVFLRKDGLKFVDAHYTTYMNKLPISASCYGRNKLKAKLVLTILLTMPYTKLQK